MPRHHQVVLSTPWSSTRVVEVGEDLKDTAVSVNHLLELALDGLREQGVEADDGLRGQLVVHHGGKRHGVHETLSLESGSHSTASTTTFARVELLGGLKGGKGGFGAMLRSMGKGGGSKKTLDFGACRDLYGRRLRHVNDEVKLKKWLEKKEQESQDRDRKRGSKTSSGGYEKTESGIPGWHLSVPGWAEFRKGKSTEHLKAKRKTVLCNDWMDARSRRPPPFGAPRWWGCPRGRECGWAHGEEELRGKGLDDLKALQAELKQKEQEASLESYVTGAAYDVPEVQSAVMEGLKREQRARKKGKTGPLELHPELEGDGAQAAQQRFLPVGFGADSFSVAQGDCPWLEVLSGNLNVGPDGSLSGGVVGEFPTVAVAGPGFETGSWYYEIELRSAEGSIQVGWVNQHFEADAVEGDGVGDDVNSWAYDGSKQVAWHNEADKPYGEKWEVGDVCGVLFELRPGGGTLSFTKNGNPLGPAFDNIPVSPTREDGGKDPSKAETGDAAKQDGAEAGGTVSRAPLRYYPALSMDEGEAVRVNIGTTPFKHPPPGLLEGDLKPVAAGLEGEFGKRMTSVASTSSTQSTPASKTTTDIVETMDVPAVPPSSSSAADTQPSAHAHTGEPASNGKAAHASNPAPNTSSPQKLSTTQQAAAPPASTPTDSKQSKQPSAPARPVEPEPLDLSGFTSAEELEALGLDRLKAALMALGVKCGGSLSERALRLLSLKDVPLEQIDPKLKAKAGVKK